MQAIVQLAGLLAGLCLGGSALVRILMQSFGQKVVVASSFCSRETLQVHDIQSQRKMVVTHLSAMATGLNCSAV